MRLVTPRNLPGAQFDNATLQVIAAEAVKSYGVSDEARQEE
jgi:hypothetical protein